MELWELGTDAFDVIKILDEKGRTQEDMIKIARIMEAVLKKTAARKTRTVNVKNNKSLPVHDNQLNMDDSSKTTTNKKNK